MRKREGKRRQPLSLSLSGLPLKRAVCECWGWGCSSLYWSPCTTRIDWCCATPYAAPAASRPALTHLVFGRPSGLAAARSPQGPPLSTLNLLHAVLRCPPHLLPRRPFYFHRAVLRVGLQRRSMRPDEWICRIARAAFYWLEGTEFFFLNDGLFPKKCECVCSLLIFSSWLAT